MPMHVQNAFDDMCMLEALALAKKGWGRTGVNPLVGAVVTNRQRVVGRGFHRKLGEAHAETVALLEAGSRAGGGTLYVNLEPCCVCGRTPPCVDLIKKAGIARVVIGMLDPNPSVNGGGVECLRQAGIRVDMPVMEQASLNVNRWYAKFITQKMPYIILKIATSREGRISNFGKRYITSEPALRFVHSLRSQVEAIMVGINTVQRDDPFLTDRLVGRSNPARVVLDPRLRIHENAHFFATDARRIIVTGASSDQSRMKNLASQGVEFIVMPAEYFLLDTVIKKLGELEIGSMMVEGGGLTFSELLGKKMFDELYVFVAPVSGGDGANMFEEISHIVNLSDVQAIQTGEDLLYHVYRNN